MGGKRRDVPPGWELRRPEREVVFRIRTGQTKAKASRSPVGQQPGLGILPRWCVGWCQRRASPMRRVISKLWTDEEGAASVEYALLLVVIVVATMGAWVSLRNRIIQSITEVENSFDQ